MEPLCRRTIIGMRGVCDYNSLLCVSFDDIRIFEAFLTVDFEEPVVEEKVGEGVMCFFLFDGDFSDSEL